MSRELGDQLYKMSGDFVEPNRGTLLNMAARGTNKYQQYIQIYKINKIFVEHFYVFELLVVCFDSFCFFEIR